MKWQEKVDIYRRQRRISLRSLADIIGISNTGLGAALDREDAWETVQTAIRLAREMGITVDYLFDPKTDWPPPPLPPVSPEQARFAVEALERIAAGQPPGPVPGTHVAGKKRGRRSR